MLAIIGGTGIGELMLPGSLVPRELETAWGTAYVEAGTVLDQQVLFLPRHGHPAIVPPHKINYRANIAALHDAKVTDILAVTAVGSVDPVLEVGDIVVPDQLIDYTWGRQHTFFDDSIHHIDFTSPYHEPTRQLLCGILEQLAFNFSGTGTYGCTQGPRLETAAEIARLHQDGCTIVGMTAMPEAALAREQNLNYTGLSVVVNKGAGLDGDALNLEMIHAAMTKSMSRVHQLLAEFLRRLGVKEGG